MLHAALAGVPSPGHPVNEPIAKQRSLPKVASHRVYTEHAMGANNSFHASFLTLRELEAFDWKKAITLRGVVSLEQQAAWNEHREKPHGYSLAFDTVSPNETILEWSSTYAKECQHFIENTLPRLKALGDPHNVRVVFWFD